jgi:hypothetical protein
MNNCKMIVYILIGIAIIVGVLSVINQSTFVIAAYISRFFEIMVPVIGFAAICKYLLCGGSCNCKCDK